MLKQRSRLRGIRWHWVVGLLLLVALGAVGQQAVGTLGGEYASGRISYRASGLGGSSGPTVKLDVTGRRAGTVQLTVPSGTMLSAGGAAQGMVISGVLGRFNGSGDSGLGGGAVSYVPEPVITVHGREKVTYLLEGYCAEFEKDNPSTDTRFSVKGYDQTLARVLRLSKQRGLSVRATQVAVWLITDHIDRDQLEGKFPVTDAEWSQAKKVVSAARAGRG